MLASLCLLNVQLLLVIFFFFFFNDTATTEIYTLSLHDALPICGQRTREVGRGRERSLPGDRLEVRLPELEGDDPPPQRSEEHTSELQSRQYLVCRLLLEKKKKKNTKI